MGIIPKRRTKMLYGELSTHIGAPVINSDSNTRVLHPWLPVGQRVDFYMYKYSMHAPMDPWMEEELVRR